MDIVIVLSIGFLLDLLIGDPYNPLHPVRLIGWLIMFGERLFRKILPKTNTGEFIGGTLLSLTTIASSYAVPFFLLLWLGSIHEYLRLTMEIILCYQILATKSLKTESMLVFKQLIKPDLQASREYLSRIVGRDTKSLDEQGIIKATIETVAENTTDGVIAPIIFIAIGGVPLGFLYKAINTLDSMIGYKNDKYLYFGKFAAKFDDVVNFFPAIIAAYMMMASSFVLNLDWKNAFKIYRRDKYNHASPNSAKTESVCAGALNVCLAGDAYYFGKLVSKPTIGDNTRLVQSADIKLVNRLMYASSALAVLFCITIRLLGVMLF